MGETRIFLLHADGYGVVYEIRLLVPLLPFFSFADLHERTRRS